MTQPSLFWRAVGFVFAAILVSGCASLAPSTLRQDGFVAAPDGTSIYYRTQGRGPPVVLLHSAFSSSEMWEPTLAALGGRRVIRVDARAHGRTPAASQPALGATDVRTVMDALGITRADLIGSSMGGGTAIDFALLYPERAGRIILVGSAPMGGSPPTRAEIEPLLEIFSTAKARGLDAGVEKWVEHPMNAAATPAVQARLRKLARQSPAMFAIGDISKFPVTFLEPFAMDRLAQLKQPVLLVIGGRDLPTLQKNARLAAAKLPNARLVVFDNVGHFPSLERPERFNGLVRQFLSGS